MTSVDKTMAVLEDQTPSQMDNMSLKVSWPLDVWDSEPRIVEKIPDHCNHLPTILFDAKYSIQELGIPWSEFSCSWTGARVTNFESRSLQLLATPIYDRLWKVKNVSELKKVWLDSVKCHYAAWKIGRVLDRDISINNIMFTRIPNGVNNDETLNVNVILNDWDLASFLDNEQVPRSGAKHRTGTLPFMAADLLVDPPPRHEFYHDLESFFWVLLWAAVFFDFSGKEPKIQDITDEHPILKLWVVSSDMKEVRRVKWSWISEPSEFQSLLELIPEVNSDLKDWLVEIRHLFRNAYYEINSRKELKMRTTRLQTQHNQNSTSEEGDQGLEGLEHQVTYAKFMVAVGEK